MMGADQGKGEENKSKGDQGEGASPDGEQFHEGPLDSGRDVSPGLLCVIPCFHAQTVPSRSARQQGPSKEGQHKQREAPRRGGLLGRANSVNNAECPCLSAYGTPLR